MGLLHNTFKLTNNQRKAVAILALVLIMNSTRVQAADVAAMLPDAPKWETSQNDPNDVSERFLRVPSIIESEPDKADEPSPTKVISVTMTAYSSTVEECDDSPFITADGSRVRDGIVAANFLKFGSKIRIPELFGDKVFEVHDRMNKRFSNRVDVWMEKVSDNRRFGIKHNVKIEIL